MRKQRLNTLIRQAIVGDPTALEQLCRMYAKTILFQTRLLVRNKDEAEDAAQKVAIAMLRDIKDLRSSYAFRSWLQRLIINTCNRQNAQSQREGERIENLELAETIVDESMDARPEDSAISEDMRRYVGGYLERLPTAQAIALTLYYYEQLSYKEVAAAMDVSIGSVSSTISKAKKNLKRMLKENGERDVLGIIFIAPFLRGNLKRTVADEIESYVSPTAVERFMVVCKAHIVNIAKGVGSTAVATGAWGTVVAVATAFALLGVIGVGAYLLSDTPEPIEPTIPQSQPVVIEPESRVTYQVKGQQFYDDPTNPVTVQLQLLSDETLERWNMVDSAGKEIMVGRGVSRGTQDSETQEGARELVRGDFIDIAALNLPDGDYTLNWFLTNERGDEFRIFWDFTIATSPDETSDE
jgi:RNA polymerase sigma-70 factor (ECF subfamily)